MELEFKQIKISDSNFLYELLKSRNPIENISHKEMPTHKQHLNFIKSKPYKNWYIILYKKIPIGSLYLSKINEIGIHMLPKYDKTLFYTETINFIIKNNPDSRLLVNVGNMNKKMISYYKKIGFQLIQYTFEKNPGD